MKSEITSIEMTNRSSGLVGPDEIIAETLKIYKTGKIKHLQYNGLSVDLVTEYDYKMKASEVNRFFDLLVYKIKIQDWAEDYSIPVCDGWSWEFKMRHSDKTVRKVNGTVEPPPRGLVLKNIIYELVDFKGKPWIL